MTKRIRSKDTLEEIAGAIADGRPIDWQVAIEGAGAAAASLRKLQLVEGIAHACHEENADLAPLPAAQPAASGSERAPGSGSHGASTGSAKTISADAVVEPDRAATLFTWGNLIALEEIGGGAFAKVYRAYDPTLDCQVALKLRREDEPQDERSTGRFIEEARKLARVRHPNVLKVHGADVHGDRVGIWTELVRGKTLSQIVKQDGPLGADVAILYGMELCGALAALHGNHIVHRDIKPSNVMLEQGGRIVLMDFGSAGDLQARPSSPRMTFSGTPVTTAPEVLVEGATPNVASDVYSLGVLLYWLVSRHYPVEGKSLSGLVQMHKRGESRPLLDVRPDVPRSFAHVVERALARDPTQRFGSIGEMQHALADAIAVRPPAKRTWRERVRPHRRRVGFAAAAAVIAIVGTAALRWYFAPANVRATLYRVRGSTTEPLASGGSVRPGDLLYLELRGDQDTYAWVVHESSDGNPNLLFPLGESETPRLDADRVYRLPFQGQNQLNWEIDAEGDRETLLVVASRRRLPEFAQRLRHRGVTTVPAAPGTVPNRIAELGDQLRGERGVWVQPILLTKD